MRGSATRRGRRTTASRPASLPACSPPAVVPRRPWVSAERGRASAPRGRPWHARSRVVIRTRCAWAGRRAPKHPLIEIGRARRKDDALAGLERWRARHAEAAAHLQPADVLVDAMRGRSSTWTRVRVNLQHVPEALRPGQEPLDPDEDPWTKG